MCGRFVGVVLLMKNVVRNEALREIFKLWEVCVVRLVGGDGGGGGLGLGEMFYCN